MPYEGKKLIFLIVFLGTFALPMSLIPVFLYRKLIYNIQLDTKRERFYPLLLTAIFYYFSFYLLRRIPVPGIIQLFILAAGATVFFNLIVSVFWKISTHMSGIGGLLGLISGLIYRSPADLTVYLLISILAAGLIGSSRLKMEAHNPYQIYAGLSSGFLIVFLLIVFK
jgi:membrane-associated phospholipid phosphatase